PPPKLVHVPSETIARFDARWGASLLGDKAHSMIFDNTKIRRFAPGFCCAISISEGAREVMEWFDSDSSRRKLNERFQQLTDKIIAAQESAGNLRDEPGKID
ncbi:MAG TPA: hypothetical protein VGS41_09555, partial [Chthonomonadales bacterium]|nr:hypothetical protein [Chthonomonadales bacterium]